MSYITVTDREYIASIGIEVECITPYASTVEKINEALSNLDVHPNIGSDCSIDRMNARGATREIRMWHSDVSNIKAALELLYAPRSQHGFNIKTNESCGLHIHIAPTAHTQKARALIAALSHEVVYNSFIAAYNKFFSIDMGDGETAMLSKYAQRKNNYFCKTTYNETNISHILKGDPGNRYNAINYASLNRNGTIEIRLMPAADSAEEAYTSIMFVVSAIEKLTAHFEKHQLLLRTHTERITGVDAPHVIITRSVDVHNMCAVQRSVTCNIHNMTSIMISIPNIETSAKLSFLVR